MEGGREAVSETQDGDVVDRAHVSRRFEPLPDGGVQDGGPAGQVAFERLEALGLHEFAVQVAVAGFVQLGCVDLEEVSAGMFQFGEGAVDRGGDVRGRAGPESGAGDGDAEAGDGRSFVACRRVCGMGEPVDGPEGVAGIVHRVREETDRVQGRAERDHARRRPPPGGVAMPNDPRRRGGYPHRAAGVASQREHGRTLPQAHARSRGGSSGHPVVSGVPRVDGRARVGIEADAPEGQLHRVGLAHDDRAQLPDRTDEKTLALPSRGEFPLRSGPDRESLDAVEVLHRDGDPGERAGIVAARHGRVHRGGLGAGALCVEDDVGAEVAGLVTTDRPVHQVAGGDLAAADAGGRPLDGFSLHGVYREGKRPLGLWGAINCNIDHVGL